MKKENATVDRRALNLEEHPITKFMEAASDAWELADSAAWELITTTTKNHIDPAPDFCPYYSNNKHTFFNYTDGKEVCLGCGQNAPAALNSLIKGMNQQVDCGQYNHRFAPYTGLREVFNHCTKCGITEAQHNAEKKGTK